MHRLLALIAALLSPLATHAETVVLPLDVVITELQVGDCDPVLQSTASCPFSNTSASGSASGTTLVTNPNGRVEMSLTGSGNAGPSSRQDARDEATIRIEFLVPDESLGVAQSISNITSSSATELSSATTGRIGFASSELFGDRYEAVRAGVTSSPSNTPTHTLLDVVPGDRVELEIKLFLQTEISEGMSSSIDETAVYELRYATAPEPATAVSLLAGIALLLGVGRTHRRPQADSQG